MLSLAETIVDKLRVASLPNALSLVDKIRWKDEKDRYPWRPLMRMVQGIALDRLKSPESEADYHLLVFNSARDFLADAQIPNIDIKLLFEHFILTVKGG